MADRLMIERRRFHCGTASASEATMPGPWSGRGIEIATPRWPGRLARRVRFEHHRDPGRVRRGGCERGLILGFGLWRGLMLDRLPVLGQPLPSARDQIEGILSPLLRRHLRDLVRDRAGK